EEQGPAVLPEPSQSGRKTSLTVYWRRPPCQDDRANVALCAGPVVNHRAPNLPACASRSGALRAVANRVGGVLERSRSILLPCGKALDFRRHEAVHFLVVRRINAGRGDRS